MSSYNSTWQEPLSSQTTNDEGEARDLRQIQTYYNEQDYGARRRRGWSNHRPNAHNGTGHYYPEEYDALYPQQQYYPTDQTDYGQRTYPSWNGGQGYGYSPGAVHSPSSLYDISSDYQRHTPQYTVTSRAFFDKGDITPAGDPLPPRSPSPSYISTSLSPSGRDEHPFRKLLILDLNGTLLLRSSPPRFRPPPPRSPSPGATEGCSQRCVPRVPPPSQPVKRAIYARPYLPCFREYLFHSSTRCWLDVMIWSSAQPHSVQTMLQKCFPIPHKLHSGTSEGAANDHGKPNDRFIAVWARDTLGLSQFDYSRKTQTTKDLHKPWSQLVDVSELDKRAVGESSLSSDPSISGQKVTRHSAKTTLLLDDSPRKAYLQPWNHVCLKEYDAVARLQDLKVLQHTPQNMPKEHIDNGTFDVLHTVEDSPSIAPPRTTESPRPTALCQYSFDPTLLAIIGILEAVKYESNVAGWIRGNGLWVEADMAKKSTPQEDAESEPAQQLVSGTKRPRDDECDVAALDSLAKPKRPRLHTSLQPDTQDSTAASLDLSPVAPYSSAPPVEIPKINYSPGRKGTKHSSEKDADNVLQYTSNQNKDIAPTDTPTCWFSHTPTFAHWVSKGRDALTRLGIDERHGVSEEEL